MYLTKSLFIVVMSILTASSSAELSPDPIDDALALANGRILKKIELDENYTLADKVATQNAGLIEVSILIPVPMIWSRGKLGGMTYKKRWWECAGRSDGNDGYNEGACNAVVAISMIDE